MSLKLTSFKLFIHEKFNVQLWHHYFSGDEFLLLHIK